MIADVYLDHSTYAEPPSRLVLYVMLTENYYSVQESLTFFHGSS